MKKPNSKFQTYGLFAIVTITLISSLTFTDMDLSASLSTSSSEELTQPQLQQQQISNNNSTIAAAASDIFNTKELILGSDTGELVILIPNEGHHGPGEENEARFIAQSFVPETAVSIKELT